MSRLRTGAGWLVGGLFVLLALGVVAAGEGPVGTFRGLLAATIFLAAAALAIPWTRNRIGDASGRTLPSRLLAALLIVGLVAGMGIAPALDTDDGDGPEINDEATDETDAVEAGAGDDDGTSEEARADDGSEADGGDTPTETESETDTPAETEDETETEASTGTETPTDDETDTDEPTETPTETDTPEDELEVHYIDVGQADATLIEFPNGETMLLDSGDWRDDGDRVLAYLDERGVDRIDHLVSTHAHADHIGGHEAVIDRYEGERDGIGAVYDSGVVHTSQTYERYLDAVERHDVTLFEVEEGDAIDVGEASVKLLNPPAGDSGSDLHYNSVALTITYGERTFLFTGDAEEDAEERMVETHGDVLASDVYQAGHHGSATSSTVPFLEATNPEIAVISSAVDSQYGHPHDEVLASLAERGIETYWTGVHGDVVVTTDGRELSVVTEREFSTDADDLREERPDDPESRALADPTVDVRTAPTAP